MSNASILFPEIQKELEVIVLGAAHSTSLGEQRSRRKFNRAFYHYRACWWCQEGGMVSDVFRRSY